MIKVITEVAYIASLPAIAMVFGGGLSQTKKMGNAVHSLAQHFAAGVVFAAVAIELLPQLADMRSTAAFVIGFCLGVALMLFVRFKTGDHLHDKTRGKTLPMALIVGVAVDLFIDGFLVGIAFHAGDSAGRLIAIGLGIEIFFLGLVTGSSFNKHKVAYANGLAIYILLALLVILGAIIGATLISTVPLCIIEALLAFGVAALLFLVTEELLDDAHKTKVDTPLITTSFFAGFLAIYLANMWH